MAQIAGVSAATVDRALHGRGGVSATSLGKIDDAVRVLGFGERTRALTHQMRPKVNLRFIVPSGREGFIQNLRKALTTACDKTDEANVTLEFIEIEMTPEIIVGKLDEARRDANCAVGLFAMDTVEVRNAIDRCANAGVPVVTMVSDVPAARRTTFIGIDNSAAGRTAGRLMGKFLRNETGKVAVIAGAMDVRDHKERYFAFRDVISQDFRNIVTLPVCETKSLDRYNMDCVRDLLARHDDLLGIYLVTGGVFGVLSGLREHTYETRPILIAHDLTTVTRRGLVSGEIDALINQNPMQIAHAAVSHLLDQLIPDRSVGTAATGSVGIEVFVADNLP